MTTPYDVSPECRERRCRVASWEDLESPRRFFQHGDNPESVLIVDEFVWRHRTKDPFQEIFREFAERCHRYEERGEVPA